MNIISYAQGHCLHLKGNMAWNYNPINAQRFFNMAMEKYEGACSFLLSLPSLTNPCSPLPRGAQQRSLV